MQKNLTPKQLKRIALQYAYNCGHYDPDSTNRRIKAWNTLVAYGYKPMPSGRLIKERS